MVFRLAGSILLNEIVNNEIVTSYHICSLKSLSDSQNKRKFSVFWRNWNKTVFCNIRKFGGKLIFLKTRKKVYKSVEKFNYWCKKIEFCFPLFGSSFFRLPGFSGVRKYLFSELYLLEHTALGYPSCENAKKRNCYWISSMLQLTFLRIKYSFFSIKVTVTSRLLVKKNSFQEWLVLFLALESWWTGKQKMCHQWKKITILISS